MKRERALDLLTAVLTCAATANGRPLSILDEIHVFGSFARGALEPHDVDLAVELTADDEFASEAAWCLSQGQDPFAPVRHALVGRRRGIEFRFHELGLLHDAGIDTTLLWRRGEDLATALARLNAIKLDTDAGRAPRDAMLSAFEGIDRHVPRPVRETLAAWSNAGAVTVERIDLAAAEASDEVARDVVEQRWGESSALRRAGHAALAHLEQEGVSAADVHLQGGDLVSGSHIRDFIGFQWRYSGAIHRCLTRRRGVQWLEIPHPTKTGPMPAVRIKVTNRDALTEQQ